MDEVPIWHLKFEAKRLGASIGNSNAGYGVSHGVKNMGRRMLFAKLAKLFEEITFFCEEFLSVVLER